MATLTEVTPATGPLPASWARPLFALNAVVAWFALAFSFALMAFDVYPNQNTDPTAIGFAGQSLFGRTVDWFSYFTIVSNIVVAVTMTMLWRDPARNTRIMRVLRLDAIMMITVTGIVYFIMLRPLAKNEGLQVYTDLLLHQIVPALTVLVFIAVGPRRLFGLRDIPAAFIIPLGWAGYCIVRGAFIGAYPYPFINVAKHGYITVGINLVAIVIFGVIIGLIALGIDRLLSRSARG